MASRWIKWGLLLTGPSLHSSTSLLDANKHFWPDLQNRGRRQVWLFRLVSPSPLPTKNTDPKHFLKCLTWQAGQLVLRTTSLKSFSLFSNCAIFCVLKFNGFVVFCFVLVFFFLFLFLYSFSIEIRSKLTGQFRGFDWSPTKHNHDVLNR